MKYSQIFGKTSKTAPSDADSVNARLLTQGGFVVKQMAGVYNYLPLGLRVLTKIQNIIREELNRAGCNEILMPALTGLENYKQTGRETMDILFHTEVSGGQKAVLNPTHEEIVTPLVQIFSPSYRDLPIAVYQIQNKFRNEPRAKSGLLRGREFNMKDLYSFHSDENDLDSFYEKMQAVYFQIYKRLGLGEQVILAFASGGMFSRYSHEFQALTEVGEDTVHVCIKCNIGINKEIIQDQNVCPKCANPDLIQKNAVEVGNIFKLGTRFTDAFNFKINSSDSTIKQVHMGCYGIGPSRIMGTLVEIFHDDKGIVWPAAVAPFQVHLISLAKDGPAKEAAEKLYAEMLVHNIEVLFDDRDGSAGEKFADADLIGIPNRVIVSKKTIEQNGVEFKKRSSETSEIVPLNEIFAKLTM